MSRRYRRAPVPTQAQLDALYEQREFEKAQRQAAPPEVDLSARNAPEEERIFRVVGPRAVAGKKNGEVVILTLSEAQEISLVAAGHIEPCVEEEESEDFEDPAMVAED